MKLRVVSEDGVVVGHKLRLQGEVLEVDDVLGSDLKRRHPLVFVRVDDVEASSICTEPASWWQDPVSSLGLSPRVLDALDANGLATVGQLHDAYGRGDAAMLELPGIGPRALEEIRAALATPPELSDKDDMGSEA